MLGGVPDLVLVMLVAVALLRGAVPGAIGGFFAGLLVDTATLGQLGLTSLVLTIAGYWIGRYGETTGRDRGHAPFTSVAVVTVLYSFGILLVHFVLGERAPAGDVVRGLLPAIVAEPHPHGARVRARAPPAAPASSAATTRPRCSSLASTAPTRAPRRPRPRADRRDRRRAVPRRRRSSRAASRFSASSCSASSPRSSSGSGRCRCSPGTKYVNQASANSFRTVRVQAPRGQILDRNGVPLVTNAAGDRDPALAGRPAEGLHGALRGAAARSRSVTTCPLYEIARGIKARRDDLVTPVTVRDVREQRRWSTISTSTPRSSRA